MRRPRLPLLLVAALGGLLVLAWVMILLALIAVKTDTDAETAADTGALTALLQQHLTPGATLAHTLIVLRSPALTAYRRVHHFAGPGDTVSIDTAFVLVASFVPQRNHAQAYPRGKAVLVGMEHEGGLTEVWGLPFLTRRDHKRLHAWLVFDQAGRYTSCRIEEDFPAFAF